MSVTGNPILDNLVRASEEVARQASAAATAAGPAYPVNPRATAVVLALMAKIVSEPGSEDIPLELLVTPRSLPTWRASFNNPEQREHLFFGLRLHGVSGSRVRPQPDGSLGVFLPRVHPDQGEMEMVSDRQMEGYMAYLELVTEPDDWRVQRIQ